MFLSLKICFEKILVIQSVCLYVLPVVMSISTTVGSVGEATGSLKFSTSSFYKFSFLPESDEPVHLYIRRCGSRAPEL